MQRRVLAIDHPGWTTDSAGRADRVVRSSSGIWRASWDEAGLDLACVEGDETDKPRLVETRAGSLPPGVPAELANGLAELGTVVRLANPWLWDAITTAVLRQVVRAAQARLVYRRWCTAHGSGPVGEGSVVPLPPGPEIVLGLGDEDFARVGAAFHRTALRAAASAYLEHAAAWTAFPATDLAAALQQTPRVGPWTAQAAAADFTGDFSIYPHSDLAVRTWAARVAPTFTWPNDPGSFETRWTSYTDTPHHLHTLTALTLAWGSHVRSPDESPVRP